MSQYLTKYAEPTAFKASVRPLTRPNETYSHVLVIPAYRESVAQLEQVWRHIPATLIILVVNSPTAYDPETQQLLTELHQRWHRPEHVETDPADECRCYNHRQHTILVVDRCSQPLTKGVGEARKIGSDIGLQLIEKGIVTTDWIHNTDADAVLPAGYFEATNSVSDELSFLLYPFQHDASSIPAALYEFSVLWFACGTQSAGSPYGYPSIGSTIACRAEAYAKVRGWPKRTAGEDFYFLNKLRKVGQYAFANCDPVQLSSRGSERVPFGTGPGILKVAALTQPISDYMFYHPDCFLELKSFLSCLRHCQGEAEIGHHFENDLQRRFLKESGLETQILAKNNQSAPVFAKFIDDWFDGFRTLKFIHYIRDHLHPSVPFDALWASELLPESAPATEIETATIQSVTRQLWQKLTTPPEPLHEVNSD